MSPMPGLILLKSPGEGLPKFIRKWAHNGKILNSDYKRYPEGFSSTEIRLTNIVEINLDWAVVIHRPRRMYYRKP